jgi:hypothetical protein
MIKIVGIEFIPRLGNGRPENGTGTFVEALIYPALVGGVLNWQLFTPVAAPLRCRSSRQHSTLHRAPGFQRARNRFADGHRGGKRFVVRSDEKLTVFIQLAWAIRVW